MSKVLLVEGVNDKHVVCNLSQRLVPKLKFKCVEKKGIDNLLKAISTEIKVSGRQAVGIVADANDNVQNRWQAISDKLSDTDVQPPKKLESDGIVIQGKPRVGVWLMPDNSSPGELEDFVIKLLPKDDPVWPRANQYIDGIPSDEREFREHKAMRAKLYAWLATREAPQQMGAAIGRSSLDADRPPAKRFANWLSRLFTTNH